MKRTIFLFLVFSGACRTLQPTETNQLITTTIEENNAALNEIKNSDDVVYIKQLSTETIEKTNTVLTKTQIDYNDCIVLHGRCEKARDKWKMFAFTGWVFVLIELLMLVLIYKRR